MFTVEFSYKIIDQLPGSTQSLDVKAKNLCMLLNGEKLLI
jgi:hypothetical protein